MTRYVVTWVQAGQVCFKGFAFQNGAVHLFDDLCQAEQEGREDISAAGIAFLGPDGERWPCTSPGSENDKQGAVPGQFDVQAAILANLKQT